MARGYLTGVLWGGIVALLGLATLSQLAAPTPPDAVAAEVAVMAAKVPEGAVVATADGAGDSTVVVDGTADGTADGTVVAAAPGTGSADGAVVKSADAAAPDGTSAEPAAVVPAEPVPAVTVPAVIVPAETAVPATTKTDGAAVETTSTAPATETAIVAPVAEVAADDPGGDQVAMIDPGPLPDLPATQEAPPSLAALDDALAVPEAEPAPAPPEATVEEPAASDTLLAPAAPPVAEAAPPVLAPADPAPDAAALPQIVDAAPQTDAPGSIAAPMEPDAAAKPGTTSTLTDDKPSTLPSVKSLTEDAAAAATLPAVKPLDDAVPGVETNKLPHIGDTATTAEPAAPAAPTPLVQFARSFDGAKGKPLFVILLRDIGAAGMSRADLAQLPFAVSFVIDPLAADAKEAAATYRAAGQEVLVLADGIPVGANASDLEQIFQSLSSIVPESVAMVDQDIGGFQDDRPLAGLVLPLIKDQGRGLVTYDRGLNAADQIAAREGVPRGVIFRRLDAEGESKSVVRRYLDRAAFKAAQEGKVMVIGDTRPETVAAILEWTIEGRAATVTLAPATAIMADQ